ncbi:MAG TPA: ATP-binding protein, partial [Actinomycetota bacterium]|nr:ATP-binding protein [Actinomycetota bacterium]
RRLPLLRGRAFERLGITPSERVGRWFVELRGDQPEATADFERLLAGEELWAKRPVGDVIFDVHYRPLLDPDGRVAGVVSVAVDVTAQEEERRRLAGDLHDDAVQSLTAARMQLSILDQAHENLEHGLAVARTFLFNLRPPLLDSAGLEPALRQQLAKLADRTGCKTEITWLLEDRLDRDLETVAFRVVQEALANVAKHADASTVRVWGEREEPMLVIAVADDGVGFDPPAAGERAAATGHLGLRSMAERIQTAGGQLEISSQPYQGTQVVLRLPE